MAAVTAGAVAKRLIAALASDKKGRKSLCYVIGITVFILCIPVIIVYALFGWMAGADEADLSEPIAHTIREEIPQEAIREFEAQWYTEINN